MITTDVVVWIHPINLVEHPTYRPGYRWAVHVGGGPPSDLQRCCNAGSAPTLQEAHLTGEAHGATACKAMRAYGIPARFVVQEIGWDPIPASADHVPREVMTTNASSNHSGDLIIPGPSCVVGSEIR